MPSRSVDHGYRGALHFFPLDTIELRAGLISSRSDTQGWGKTEDKLIFLGQVPPSYLEGSASVPHLSNEPRSVSSRVTESSTLAHAHLPSNAGPRALAQLCSLLLETHSQGNGTSLDAHHWMSGRYSGILFIYP